MNLKLHAAMSRAFISHMVYVDVLRANTDTQRMHRSSSQLEARSKSLLLVLSTLFPQKLACSNIKISEREKEREVETRAGLQKRFSTLPW